MNPIYDYRAPVDYRRPTTLLSAQNSFVSGPYRPPTTFPAPVGNAAMSGASLGASGATPTGWKMPTMQNGNNMGRPPAGTKIGPNPGIDPGYGVPGIGGTPRLPIPVTGGGQPVGAGKIGIPGPGVAPKEGGGIPSTTTPNKIRVPTNRKSSGGQFGGGDDDPLAFLIQMLTNQMMPNGVGGGLGGGVRSGVSGSTYGTPPIPYNAYYG